MSSCFFASERFSLFLDQCLGTHQNPWDTKPTLQSTVRCKGIAIAVELLVIEPFKRNNLFACCSLYRCLTSYAGLIPYKNRATTALARRRATIFGRNNTEFIAQGAEEMLVRTRDRYWLPIQIKRGHMDPFSRDISPYISGRR